MNITWTFDENEQGDVVTATFGRCKIRQMPGGSILAMEPAGLTEEERRTRRTLFERAVDTGKIWVEGAR